MMKASIALELLVRCDILLPVPRLSADCSTVILQAARRSFNLHSYCVVVKAYRQTTKMISGDSVIVTV